MPVTVARTAPRRTVRCATVRHDGGCMPPHAPGRAVPCHVPSGEAPERRVAGELERSLEVAILPRQVACRGGRLPVPDSVPAIRPCRGAWRATAGFSCGAWVRPSRQAPLVGGSVVPASSSCRGLVFSARQAPLAGGLVLYAWSSLGASRGGPCRGVLRLPVHKSGVLRYPHFSTPTGAPGPGPYTVPSAVGPGPKQCTGTRGLGHAASASASTTPSPNGTRRMRHRGERRASRGRHTRG